MPSTGLLAGGRGVQAKSLVVTDMGTKMYVDPGGNGAILNVEGPGPPGGGRSKQLVPDSGDG